MSEKFSATLRIGDLNDFIAPSQDCIVSLKGKKITAAKPERTEVATSSKSLQIVQTEPVKISLKDCLACSGCITSAETVMLEKQSLDEFLSSINKGKAVIVSISPQSRAAFAVHFGLSPLQVLRKFVTFFKSLGVKAIFDTSCSRDISLIESCNEFIARYRQSHDERCKSSLPMLASACPAREGIQGASLQFQIGMTCVQEWSSHTYVPTEVSTDRSSNSSLQRTMSSALSKILLALFAIMLIAQKSDGQQTHWCIAKENSSPDVLQKALDWACGAGGANCTKIKPDQPCYLPNTLQDHASFAFNNFFQMFKEQGATCNINGCDCGKFVTEDPSHGSCVFDQ